MAHNDKSTPERFRRDRQRAVKMRPKNWYKRKPKHMKGRYE